MYVCVIASVLTSPDRYEYGQINFFLFLCGFSQVNISAVNKQRPVNTALEREAASCLPVAVSLSLSFLAVEVSAVEEPRI